MESIIKLLLFYAFAAAAVVSAVMVVVKKNPVSSAMSLVVTFFSLSGIYVLLNSQFIAVMQVLVYAGAIMVLIIFVIMLLNLRASALGLYNKTASKAAVIIIFVLAMFVSLVAIVVTGQMSDVSGMFNNAHINRAGGVQVIARAMFSDFLLPFELTSLLITVAIIGAVVMSRGAAKKQ